MKLQIVLLAFLITYLSVLLITYLFQIKMLIVSSNSMKPEFEFADVLLALRQEHYGLNDVISFEVGNSIATHRILSVRKIAEENLNTSYQYQTKGDANKSADLTLIKKEKVVGKIIAVIPKLGYLILFIKSKYMSLGLVFLLILILAKETYKKVYQFTEKNYEK